MADPDVVLDRLRRLSWRYDGGTGKDLAFIAAVPFLFGDDVGEIQASLFRQVVYLARYLRQSVEWILDQPLDELARYSEALDAIVRAENGKPDLPAPGPPQVARPNPWGFSDYDGGG